MIIWALESKDDTLSATLAYIVENAAEFLQSHDIVFDVQTPLHPAKATLTGGQRRSLFLAVQEALHNVAKHAKAQKVSMIFENTDTVVKISIRDNGIGFKPNAKPGRGTDTLRKNMEAVGGTAETHAADPGTEVTLQFPIAP